MATKRYNHLVYRVEYPRERGYRMEASPLPDWVYISISEENSSKYMTVHSRIHINKEVRISPDYSTDFSDMDIIKELSGEVCRRFL